MSSRSAARTRNVRRPPVRGYSRAAQAQHDADAFLVTMLTIVATMIALYDLVLLGSPFYR